MTIGMIIFVVGLFMQFSIWKAPGDIVIKKGNTTFYFPIVTSIVLSIVSFSFIILY